MTLLAERPLVSADELTCFKSAAYVRGALDRTLEDLDSDVQALLSQSCAGESRDLAIAVAVSALRGFATHADPTPPKRTVQARIGLGLYNILIDTRV